MHDVRCEKINGVWVPMSASYDSNLEYADGRVNTVTTHHKRLTVDLEPDFAALGAFVPSIPDGTRVANLDFPHVQHQWKSRGFDVVVDAEVIETIKTQASSLTSRGPASRDSYMGVGTPRATTSPVDRQFGKDSPTSRDRWVVLVASGSAIILVLGTILWFWYGSTKTRNAAP
jgi:hypothetical protein